MDKLQIKGNLYYRLEMQMTTDVNQAIIIQSPLTIKVNINRDTGGTFGTAQITVINLKEETRNAIAKPRYIISQFTSVTLYAGYNASSLSRIFIGNLLQCKSQRSGTEIETLIIAQEGIFAANNAKISASYNKGFSFQNFITELWNSMTNVETPQGNIDTGITMGAIGNVGTENTFNRGVTISGNSFVVLNKYFKHQVFFTDNKGNILNINDTFQSSVFLISNETGLLNAPIIQNNYLELEMLFEPQIVIGQIVEVRSQIFKNINGQWKVMGLTHDLIISEGVTSKGITKLQLFLGTTQLNLINNPGFSV